MKKEINRPKKVRIKLLTILYQTSLISIKNIKKDKSKRLQDPYIGEFLNDRYEVVKRIGKGSFGSVYLVDDTKIDIK